MKRNNVFLKIEKLLSRAKEVSKEKGVYYVIRSGIKITFTWLEYYYHKIFKSLRTFTFQEDTYNYFIHRYNTLGRTKELLKFQLFGRL